MLALRIIELDSWDWSGASCFDEVLDSAWIAELGGKVTDAHRHFVLQETSRLVAAANVMVPAILLLERQGWHVEHAPSLDAETWSARRGSTEVVASDPLELVGLAAISDSRGSAWRASDLDIEEAIRRFRLAGG